MNHGGADFDAGREAVEHDAAGLLFQLLQHFAHFRSRIRRAAVQRRRQVAASLRHGGAQVLQIAAEHDHGAGAKGFLVQFRAGAPDGGIHRDEGGRHRGETGGGAGQQGGNAFNLLQRPRGGAEMLLHIRREHGGGGNGDHLFGEPGDKRVRTRIAHQENKTRLGAELANPHGNGLRQAGGDGLGAFSNRTGQNDERVYAAHLGEHGNRHRSSRRQIEQRPAGAFGAGKANGLRGGMFCQRLPHGDTGSMHEAKHFQRQTGLLQRRHDGVTEQFVRARMAFMRLDHHGIAGGEGGGGVAPAGAVGEGKIARAKNHHGADGPGHPAEVGLGQRLAGGVGGINGGRHPGALAQDLGKMFELVAGAGAFASQARERQAGFGMGALEQVIPQCHDLRGDGFEQFDAAFHGNFPGDGKYALRGRHHGLHLGDGGVKKGGFQRRSGGGIEGSQRFFAAGNPLAGDQLASV